MLDDGGAITACSTALKIGGGGGGTAGNPFLGARIFSSKAPLVLTRRGIGGRVGPPMGNTGGRARSTGGRNAGGGRGGRGTGGRGRGGPQRMDVQQPKKQTAAKKKAKKPRKPKAKAAPKQPLTAEALDAGLDAYKAQAMES